MFGSWDPIPDDGYASALNAGVLQKEKHLDPIKDFLSAIKPMSAAFDTDYVKKLDGTNKKSGTKIEQAEEIRADIRRFKEENGCERLVMVWCASTEVFLRPGAVHETLESFEQAMRDDDPGIAPSMLYAYAALMEGVPYANGAPNLSADVPALEQLAADKRRAHLR